MVVEVDEHRSPLTFPLVDASGPPLQIIIRVRAAVEVVAERPRGAFTVITNPWGWRDRQEREGSVWWSAVVGAINFDGVIVMDVAIEFLARR